VSLRANWQRARTYVSENVVTPALAVLRLGDSQYKPLRVSHQPPSSDPNAWHYDSANRLLSRPGVTYTYDNNGNTVSKADSSGTTTYSYDFENRLKQVNLPNGTVVSYQYDPFGRRISKTISGVGTRYLYDRADILKEYDGSGIVLATYTHGPGIDEPISMTRGGQTSYYHADGLGSIVGLTNGSQGIAQTYQYDSFGNITNQTGALQSPFTYTGRENDTETGLYYYRARYYDPEVGRFLTQDPIGLIGGVNLYRYVGNNPITWVDPYGMLDFDASIGASIGLVDIAYGTSGLELGLVTPAFAAGVNFCLGPDRDATDADCPDSPNDDEAIESVPLTWSAGIGKYSGLSFTDDFKSWCLNIGGGWSLLPINVYLPLTTD
jgi:RHS repeat-associated protein